MISWVISMLMRILIGALMDSRDERDAAAEKARLRYEEAAKILEAQRELRALAHKYRLEDQMEIWVGCAMFGLPRIEA